MVLTGTVYGQDIHLLPQPFFTFVNILSDLRLYAAMFAFSIPYLSEVSVAITRLQVTYHSLAETARIFFTIVCVSTQCVKYRETLAKILAIS